MLVLAWARTYDLEYIILRPTNNYGIGQYPEKFIPLSVKNLMRDKKIRLHNAGTPVRNWLHADDTAEAVMAIIDSGATNEVFNVAGGFEQKNIDTVLKVIDHFHESEYKWEDHVDFSYSREGQDVRYALNDDKLRALGWAPKKKFDEEIYDIVQYYKEKFYMVNKGFSAIRPHLEVYDLEKFQKRVDLDEPVLDTQLLKQIKEYCIHGIDNLSRIEDSRGKTKSFDYGTWTIAFEHL